MAETRDYWAKLKTKVQEKLISKDEEIAFLKEQLKQKSVVRSNDDSINSSVCSEGLNMSMNEDQENIHPNKMNNRLSLPGIPKKVRIYQTSKLFH
jgi:hypothetical protein